MPCTASLDAVALRSQLMASDPMQRVSALHAIELNAAGAGRLGGEVERFTARGIPYYAPHDEHYRAWVGRAVTYWERLQAGA